MSKSCNDCVFKGVPKFDPRAKVCDYPIPAWVRIRGMSGNFVNGYEAEDCPLYKTKADLIDAAKGKE